MDLKELRIRGGGRHPWEIARARSVARVLRPMLREDATILDVGCGDGYLGREICAGAAAGAMTGVDINLTGEGLGELERKGRGIVYRNSLPDEGKDFDLLLLMDVLEHVEDDRSFLAELVRHHVKIGGRVLVSVPAFPELYCEHDRFLGHYRRYRLSVLEEVVEGAGLRIVFSGYLFSSLLLPKLLLFKFLDLGKGRSGVARWRGGRLLTAVIASLLELENALLLAAAKRGVKVPGLSAWALCGKDLPCRTPRRK